MQTEFQCSCGETITATDEWLAVTCPRCGKHYEPDAERELFQPRSTPIVETAVARWAAWGCFFPAGLFVTALAVTRYILQEQSLAEYLLASGLALLFFGCWILKRNKYTQKALAKLLGLAAVVIAIIAGNLWHKQYEQALLDDKFKSVIQDLQKSPSALPVVNGRLSLKCVPILKTPRDVHEPKKQLQVDSELISLFPKSLLATDSSEVRTIVLINWEYELVAHYVSQDSFREHGSNVYVGKCSIKFIDRNTNEVRHVECLFKPHQAPQQRPGEDVTEWYGPQPTVDEVLERITSIHFDSEH